MDADEWGKRLSEGDPNVLAEIHCVWGDTLRGWLNRRFGARLDGADIEDVYIDTLVKVFEKRQQYRVDSKTFRAWFKTILRNTAVDLVRQKAREKVVCWLDLVLVPASNSNQRVLSEKVEQYRRLLLIAMAELSVLERAVMNRYSMSDSVIAEELSISKNYVRQIRFRSKQKLQRIIAVKKSGSSS